MPRFRLSYPASIYATVEGADFEAARAAFLAGLDEVQASGLRLDPPATWGTAGPGATVWPDMNGQNELEPANVGLEDVED